MPGGDSLHQQPISTMAHLLKNSNESQEGLADGHHIELPAPETVPILILVVVLR